MSDITNSDNWKDMIAGAADRPAGGAVTRAEVVRTNAIMGVRHERAVATTLSEAAAIIGRTLGPGGSMALVCPPGETPFATKDGFTVLSHVRFAKETSEIIMAFVRSVAFRLVRRVGDGSTSAVVMSNWLHDALGGGACNDCLREGSYPPAAISAAINEMADAIGRRVLAEAVPADEETMGAVAMVSSNNNPELGAMVADIYRKYGNCNVTVVDGTSDDTVTTIGTGYRINRGMSHLSFANTTGVSESEPGICEFENAVVMLLGHQLDRETFMRSVAPVMHHVHTSGRPFVVLCREVTREVNHILGKIKEQSPNAQILVVDYPMASHRSTSRVGDLAAVLNADVIHPSDSGDADEQARLNSLYLRCGSAARVTSTSSETTFIPTDESSAEMRAALIEEMITDLTNGGAETEATDAQLRDLHLRIGALRGNEVVIEAGGTSPQERAANRMQIEDTVRAVEAAKRSGVVQGLGLTMARALLDGTIGAEVTERLLKRARVQNASVLVELTRAAFMTAIVSTASLVLRNSGSVAPEGVIARCIESGESYDVVRMEFLGPDDRSIATPAETDVEVIRAAAGLAALLIGSDQTIMSRISLGENID